MILDKESPSSELNIISSEVIRPASPPGLSKDDQHDSAIELQRMDTSDAPIVDDSPKENGERKEEKMEIDDVLFEIQDTPESPPPIELKEPVIDKSAVIQRAFARLKPKSQDSNAHARINVHTNLSYHRMPWPMHSNRFPQTESEFRKQTEFHW
jgi:hypothetical protein